MTIDGTNILTTYGLKLIKVEGWESLPARKKILVNQGFTSDDILRQAKEVVLSLYGKFSTEALLGSKITSFKTYLTGDITRDYDLGDIGITFTGAVPNGMAVKVRRKIAQVELRVVVVEV